METAMRRAIVLSGLIVLGGLTLTAAAYQGRQAQPAGPTPETLAITKIEKVKDNLYMITGSLPGGPFSGGNTAVFITASGVVLVDTKNPGWGQTILDLVKTVTSKPVTMVINTHTHGDHTGSNEFFASAETVVQENTKANMERMDAFKGDKAKFLPKKTYKDKTTLLSGKDAIDLYYYGAGHTNGDTFVVFRDLRVMHAGDMFPWKDAGFIDRSNGGSGVAWPASLDKVLKNVKNVDSVIGGHQTLASWDDLRTFQRYSADLLAQSEAAHKAGKSADEAAAAIDLGKYSGFQSMRVKAAVQAIYDELNKK
jgi:glyoxylase-like metal-dependent hydrolase (beta-lactamase superfamily II)